MPETGLAPATSEDRPRVIADFIAGMTDHFVLREIERLRRLGLPVPEIEVR